jgi:hypothetical protein
LTLQGKNSLEIRHFQRKTGWSSPPGANVIFSTGWCAGRCAWRREHCMLLEASMRRLACLAVVPLLMLLPARADALTVRDVIELTRAGLGDEIILALIDVDPSVFPIDTATLKHLKQSGVSERVILAMVQSARTLPPPPQPVAVVAEPAPLPAPVPQVIVIEHHDAPQIREVPVAVPVYIPVATRSTHHHSVQQESEPDRGLDRAQGEAHRAPVKTPEPVYWGFGGKLRPDATVRKKPN